MKIFLIILNLLLLEGKTYPFQPEFVPIEQGNQANILRLFLCGDVMTGRGIDQALPHPVSPDLYENWVKDARIYLNLAQQKSGNIPIPLSWKYIWGDAFNVWNENDADLKLINLETSITSHPEPWPGKGINYRMSPENVRVLTAAGINHCSLANNHIMDWGKKGLLETLQALDKAGIKYSGAGFNKQQAENPSIFELPEGRILIFSYAALSSGVPGLWQAEEEKPGINLLNNLGKDEVMMVKQQVEAVKQSNDIVVFSVHWGPNWGYSVPENHQRFSHMLIEMAGVDLIFGHSSHHPLGLEVHNNKLIIYGAGDFINDYEGISGHEEYRGELVLMYFPELDSKSAILKSMKMVPMEVKKFKLQTAFRRDARWLQQKLNTESEKFGARVHLKADNSLWLEW